MNRRFETIEPVEPPVVEEPEPALPEVSFNVPEVEPVRSQPRANASPPPAPPAPSQSGQPQADDLSYYRSSLVPSVQGSLFSTSYAPQPSAAVAYPQALPSYENQSRASEYVSQNNQQNKQSFLESSSQSGVVIGGRFHGENAIWQGTVIPGILITSINTDLPGNVLSRVTQNIYDSQTGRSLLIPQGTLLLARYNSSVSYAQNRVQIVWDAIIRPDGLEIDLGGANGVDREGMSGQSAEYQENWFEYLKAAGIIALFSIANAKMTEAAAQYSADETAASVAASGAQVTAQLGENIISRALNIQPRLTVDNGTLINIMLNKTLYLPPVKGNQVTQKYILR